MPDNPIDAAPVRRVVTGHDAAGKAVVWLDSPAANRQSPDPSLVSTLIWATEAVPTDFTADEDMGEKNLGTAPPPGGTRFSVLDIRPGERLHGKHRTDTLDYVICVSGRIDMDLDDSTVTLHAGDVMVQRGTNHNWVNRGDQPARIACILVDGTPKRPGSLGSSQRAR